MLILFKDTHQVSKFWNWFNRNIANFESHNTAVLEKVLQELNIQLKKVCPGIFAEVSKTSEGQYNLVISTGGCTNRIKVVKELIDNAPTIPNWKFTAFKQKVNSDFTILYKNLEFTPSKMYFYPIHHNECLDVIVYIKDINGFDYVVIANFGFKSLDNILGEYDCITKLRHIDFQDLNTEPNKACLLPLSELPKYVHNYASKNTSLAAKN